MKKENKSSFTIGQTVTLTKNYGRYIKHQSVTILDNAKKGKHYTVLVTDTRNIVDNVPSKYLKK